MKPRQAVNPNKALWEKGDFTEIAALMRESGEAVVKSLGITVEAGNKRVEKAGLKRLKFQEGDACNLEGVRDHSFDLTLSMFGAMFAPKPFDVAKEMVRVTNPAVAS